jgi:hypothetical protein
MRDPEPRRQMSVGQEMQRHIHAQPAGWTTLWSAALPPGLETAMRGRASIAATPRSGAARPPGRDHGRAPAEDRVPHARATRGAVDGGVRCQRNRRRRRLRGGRRLPAVAAGVAIH